MRINLEEIMMWIFIVLMLVCFCFMGTGCHMVQKHEQPTEVLPDTLTVRQHIYTTLHKSDWLVTASILGIGAGFFSFLNGGSRGLQIMAACFIVLSFTLMVGRFAMGLSIITAVASALLLLYTVIRKDKALKEIVGGVQNFKYKYDATEDPIESLKSQLDKQSSSTKELVAKVKKDNGFDKL